MLGAEQLPAGARAYLSSTLTATRRQSGRVNSISLAASPNWKLRDATLRVSDGTQVFHAAGEKNTARGIEINFVNSFDEAQTDEEASSLMLTLTYPATPPIRVMLAPSVDGVDNGASSNHSRRLSLFGNGFPLQSSLPNPGRSYRIQNIEVDGVRLSLDEDGLGDGLLESTEIRVLKPEFSGDGSSTRF